MRSVIMRCGTDAHGQLGMFLAGTYNSDEMNACITGDQFAHDVIEHVNGPGRIGMIDDEMEALGALWALRGQYGWLRRNDRSWRSCEEMLAGDLSRMAVQICTGEETYYRNLYPRGYAHEFDASFEGAIEMAREETRRELKHYAPEDFEKDNVSAMRCYWTDLLAALRAGARKAQRKYRTYRRGHDMFWLIADAVNRYCEHPEYEGAEYRVSYDTNRCIVTELYDDY